MISTQQLVYALAVEKNLHFKKATEQCHISQSALSTSPEKLLNKTPEFKPLFLWKKLLT